MFSPVLRSYARRKRFNALSMTSFRSLRVLREILLRVLCVVQRYSIASLRHQRMVIIETIQLHRTQDYRMIVTMGVVFNVKKQ